MMEYYHADRLNYAVAGTPNRLEYDQGFFVKNGDGSADFKPIAHLYKTQVYQLAEYLGVPEVIRNRPPTTDTYSLPQSQEEFFFSLPYDQMDLCLCGKDHGDRAGGGRRRDRPHRRASRVGLPRHRREAPRRPLPARETTVGRVGEVVRLKLDRIDTIDRIDVFQCGLRATPPTQSAGVSHRGTPIPNPQSLAPNP